MDYKLIAYWTDTGKVPFYDWLDKLSDKEAQITIRLRLDRMRMGNFGTCTPVGTGIYELKFYIGPGYRVYFSKVGSKIVLLLCGGDKGSQAKDIAKAKKYLEIYKMRGEKHG